LLKVSEATVAREWRSARAWLAVEIRRSLTGKLDPDPIESQ
jgi:hypothetical protein